MKKLILIFTFGLTNLIFAQTTNYSAETLKLFNDQNWNDLIKIGNEALDKNQSTYEIEYRLAVAYYNTKLYFDSAKHFENIKKTYKINNDYIQEYLYYSYLFSAREQDALLILKNSPFHLKQKIKTKEFEFIDYISSEGGIKASSIKDSIENLSYFNLGVGQKLGYHLKLTHAYTSLSQNYLDFDYKQKEYYLNANIHVSQGLTLIPAYHYISIKENIESTIRRNNSPNNSIDITRANDEKTHLLHFALKKQWSRFYIMPSISYSSANLVIDTNQEETRNNTQYGLDMGYTVKGSNDKLWLGFGTSILNDNNENKSIWNAKAYYQLNSKAFLYFKYLNANTSNFSEENGMYYYNSVSILVDKISATFGYNFTPEFSWFINYQYENDDDLVNDFSFTYNTYITSLKYNF